MRFLLAVILIVPSVTGCSGGGLPFVPAPDDTAIAASPYRYVISQLRLPQQKSDFAIDLNGDGVPDNQFGNIYGALATQMLDSQAALDALIASGADNQLLMILSRDPALQNDAQVAVWDYAGRNGKPDFSGGGSFAIDGSAAPALFTGALTQGSFSSENPVTTRAPVTLKLNLVFGLLDAPPLVALAVHGAHIQFNPDKDAATGAPVLVSGQIHGQIHGSIKKQDVDAALIPQLAAVLNMRIRSDPASASSKQIASVFDTGNCTNPNGTIARAGDRIIDYCEVAQNSIIKMLLAPDVEIDDAAGNFAPNPANTRKDSLSMGLAFTAVRANF